MIIDELGIRDLDEKDELLWKALEALAQLRPSQPVLNEIEAFFGVATPVLPADPYGY